MTAAIPSKAIVSGTQLRAVDGSAYWITADSLFEYVFHPVFLRFFLTAALVYVFLDSTEQGNTLDVWAYGLVFTICSVIMLLWLCLAGNLLSGLARSGHIRFVYTPLLLLPMVALGEMSGQIIIETFGGIGLHPLPKTLMVIGRDTAIVLLFDYLHGQFVAPLHPLASTQRKAALPAQAAPDTTDPALPQPAPQEIPPEAAPAPDLPALPAPAPIPRPTGTIRIGAATLALADIVMIRTEDHYLGITTRTGKTLQRAKLSDLAELHEAGIGMQINRSVWIAFGAIATVEDAERGQILVTLTNGEEERVAKPRVFAFRQMYRGN